MFIFCMFCFYYFCFKASLEKKLRKENRKDFEKKETPAEPPLTPSAQPLSGLLTFPHLGPSAAAQLGSSPAPFSPSHWLTRGAQRAAPFFFPAVAW